MLFAIVAHFNQALKLWNAFACVIKRKVYAVFTVCLQNAVKKNVKNKQVVIGREEVGTKETILCTLLFLITKYVISDTAGD